MILRVDYPPLVREILTHDDIFQEIKSEHIPDKESLLFPFHKETYWLTDDDQGTPIGLTFFYPIIHQVYTGHIYLFKKYRGRRGVKFGKESIEWIFNNTDCIKIQGWTPVTDKHVIRFNKLIGLKKEGISENSYMKNGKLIDQIIFGESKWAAAE